jgi:sortase A
VTYALVLSPLQAHHEQGVLYSKFRQEVAQETAPIGGSISPSAPVAVLDMPAAGLRREVVVEGTASGDLMKGPGHLRDSALPGQAGLCVLLGRAELFGGPFGRIASLHAGATIKITTGEGVATYVVTAVDHAHDPGPPALASGAGRLLLVTADSSGWRSGWAPSNSVFVYAGLKSKPFGSEGGAPSSVPTAELPMQGDPSALYELVLWLPLLLGAALALVWAVDRWGRWQAWVVGVPILLATLWGVSQSAIQLLPNLM